MKRNRRLGKFYIQEYSEKKFNSPYINKAGGAGDFSHFGWDQESSRQLKGRLKMLDEALEQRKQAVEDALQAFKNYQQERVNAGRKRPEQMPSQYREPWERAEAATDILQEEIQAVKKALAKAEEKDKQKGVTRKVLPYGPKGSSTLRDGVINQVDGQVVALDEKNIPVIDDKRSPYNGMKVADYFETIVRPWVRELRKNRGQAIKAARASNSKARWTTPPLPEWDKKVNERPGK